MSFFFFFFFPTRRRFYDFIYSPRLWKEMQRVVHVWNKENPKFDYLSDGGGKSFNKRERAWSCKSHQVTLGCIQLPPPPIPIPGSTCVRNNNINDVFSDISSRPSSNPFRPFLEKEIRRRDYYITERNWKRDSFPAVGVLTRVFLLSKFFLPKAGARTVAEITGGSVLCPTLSHLLVRELMTTSSSSPRKYIKVFHYFSASFDLNRKKKNSFES